MTWLHRFVSSHVDRSSSRRLLPLTVRERRRVSVHACVGADHGADHAECSLSTCSSSRNLIFRRRCLRDRRLRVDNVLPIVVGFVTLFLPVVTLVYPMTATKLPAHRCERSTHALDVIFSIHNRHFTSNEKSTI